ncbi:MAG: hypothetical protein Q8R08_00425 [bacterium]|nr:hypothetical protein [bacterium]
MTKTFAMLVGWVLVIVGVLNFFVEPIRLLPAHGIFHIVAGALGIWSAKMHSQGYAMWVGVVGILLVIIGLMTKDFLGLINLPTWITVIHAVLGIWGLWTYFASRKSSMTPATPGAM